MRAAETARVDRLQTQYVRSGGAYIAYQVSGDGPLDLVFSPGGFQHVELWWESRHRRAFIDRLGELARVIRFDKRGTGMSDRSGGLPPLETQVDDVGAVLDAVGSERAVLYAVHDTAPLVLLFAATHPQRTQGLVLWHPRVASTRNPDMPWLPTADEYERGLAAVEQEMAQPGAFEREVAELAPSIASEEERQEFARVLRLSTSPGDAAAYWRLHAQTDVRHVLASIRVPTLVLARESPTTGRQSRRQAEFVAERIATARLAVVPGADEIPSADHEAIVAELRTFLEEVEFAPPEEPDRLLATVLFTDIVGSTARSAEVGDAAWRELLRHHHARVRRELARFRGREVDTAGDGFFATFDGPARAIRCACAVREAVRELGLDIRAGLHAGECELLDGKVAGIAVSLGARVAARAQPGEVLVSSTVKDLVAGSGIEFADRGAAELKGIPGEWRLYAVV
jgi:class 3 adenylate cyclase